MGSILVYLGALIARVAPSILGALKPLLEQSAEAVWHVAYPIAIQIVQDVEHLDLPGLEKHVKSVELVAQEVVKQGKLAISEVPYSQLGLIVLSAFVNSGLQGKPAPVPTGIVPEAPAPAQAH